MKRLTLACTLAMLLAVPGGHTAYGGFEGAQTLPIPQHVSPETRTELSARMGRHGNVLERLVRSVVLLDRPTIRTLASRIADEEIFARAGGPVRERRRLSLPPEVFTEGTQLSAIARQLAAAAIDGSDDSALADRFAALTHTCVSCHSVYLHGRPDTLPLAPKR